MLDRWLTLPMAALLALTVPAAAQEPPTQTSQHPPGAPVVEAAPGSGYEGELTAHDYMRAERFLSANARERVYGVSVNPNWIEGQDAFWYRNRFPEGFEFVRVDAADGERARAFDHSRLAAALSRAMDEAHEPFNLPFTSFDYIDDGAAIEFTVEDERWSCRLSDYVCEGPMEAPPSVPNSIESPDGRYAAYIEEHDLWVRDLESEEDIRLTHDGEERYGYATDSQGWRRTDTPVLVWSPDSRRIATYRLDERQVEEMHLLRTAEPRPELESWPYALPGDEHLPMHERIVVDVEAREVVALDMEPDYQRTSSCCGLTRGPAWADVEWREDGELLAFASTSRDYSTVTLRMADPETGEVEDVFQESHPKFFLTNIRSGGVPNWRVLHESGEFIWFSERDGFGHLFLYDLETGGLRNRITGGDWNVVDILDVDEENRRIVFTGVGREDGVHPYHRRLYAVGFEGGEPELLTEEDGNHQVRLSPTGEHFVTSFSTPEVPTVTEVRRTSDGAATGVVEEADASEMEEIGWRPPRPFTARARDGVTRLHGLIYKPSDFDPQKSYPIINHIYPGPQRGSVRHWRFDPSGRGSAHALAELGFIVVQLDAPGNPFRSKAFHSAYFGDMGDNGLEDQKRAMQQLADRHEWIDLDRVGIFGHSGGGFATAAALLRYPDFFHVGVSSAGNHDNRGYTDYWGERWHGPYREDEEGRDNYEHQANHLLAEDLEGDLLLSYGTMDSNVHPNMTLLLIDALIEHDHDFDVMVYPNRGHGYSNEPHNVRRTWDYFVRNLMGAKPPRNYEIGR